MQEKIKLGGYTELGEVILLFFVCLEIVPDLQRS